MKHGTKDFWMATLRVDGAAFRVAISEDDVLGAPVPSCPGWTVADLTRHVGTIYQWVRGHAGRGVVDRPETRPQVAADAPAGAGPDVIAWFEAELAQLDAFLEALDADRPAWNWAPQAKTAGFWHRRMAHETAIHRWDAQLSTGLSEPIEAKLAADTVAEVLDTWLPAGRRKGPTDMHGMVRLTATDPGPEWYVRLRGGGIALLDTDTILDDDEHPARAAAAGTASDLALALWGRVTFEVLETAGDERLLEALRVG
jgi:uncharacterized protein (TIGR03083 family)